MSSLRNRLVLLHHFSDLFCPSLPMFHLQDTPSLRAGMLAIGGGGLGSHLVEVHEEVTTGLDALRGVLVSSAKVGGGVASSPLEQTHLNEA